MTANGDQRLGGAHPALAGPTVSAMIQILGQENPQSDRKVVETAGKAAAAVSDITVRLSPSIQRLLARNHGFQRRVEAALIAALERLAETAQEEAPPETMEGEGLGELLSTKHGRKRLRAYAEPVAIEDWAGPVAGPSALKSQLGIARSTLHAWQQQGAVIGLLTGVRKHVFPLEQFIDARPIPGLADILAIIGDGRTAWLWLITPHPGLATTPAKASKPPRPIENLKTGDRARVAGLAREDYGQP
ncbi:hypothetical protein PMI01_03850 [Caulobacter sp. AP07]|uniref:antitoxin Xre/MbcA/ParS-like domain-containing protein n=1 Tax=Caulobacter sp. AP07 TaxID=1144304 RepID=UPI000272117F|nr:hypothetical protein [Caulobacter sp. AP07]EJL27369.1 hypothetical protein PMI01_03850 [Caulobacter sp. AP07]